MTDEEADALDDYFTKNPPKVSGNGTNGFFARRREVHLVGLDDLSASYLLTKASAVCKTPTELIGEMVRKEILSAVVQTGK
jgi:hypothetical protein